MLNFFDSIANGSFKRKDHSISALKGTCLHLGIQRAFHLLVVFLLFCFFSWVTNKGKQINQKTLTKVSHSLRPMDCSPQGSSIHGILQARMLEWVSTLFSRESSQTKDWNWLSCIAVRLFTIWATREAPCTLLTLFPTFGWYVPVFLSSSFGCSV